MRAKAIVLIFGILISSTISQTAVESVSRTEVVHLTKYPLYSSFTEGASIDAIVNTLTPLASTATETTNLYDTWAAIVTLVTTESINRWKEAVKSSATYQNFASDVMFEESEFQNRLSSAKEKMKQDLLNPPVRRLINETIQDFSRIENFIRFVNQTNRQVVENSTRINEAFSLFRSQAPSIIEENGFMVKKASELITQTVTELDASISTHTNAYNARVNLLITCTNTFATQIETMLNDYPANVATFYENFKTYRSCPLTTKAAQLSAEAAVYQTLQTGLVDEFTTFITPKASKINELQTSLNIEIATLAPPADITNTITLGKGLWNILIQARDNVEYFGKESKRLEGYWNSISEKLISDFSNTQTASFMFDSQLHYLYDQSGNSLQILKRIRETYTKVSAIWGYWSTLFDERAWTSIASVGITTAPNLNLSGFKAFSFDLNREGVYGANVKVKQVNCFLTTFIEELQFVYTWVENASATPPSFLIKVAFNNPQLANRNLKCGVIFDTSVTADQVGTPLADIAATNEAYNAITATAFTP